MDIKTNDFALDEGEYFNLLFVNNIKSRWWFFAVLIAAVFYFKNPFLLILAGVYLGLAAMEIAFSLGSEENKPLFKQKFCKITEEAVIVYFKDGDLQKIRWENIAKAVRGKSYYRLHLTRKNYIHLPFKAFGFEEDRKNFDAFLVQKELLRKHP